MDSRASRPVRDGPPSPAASSVPWSSAAARVVRSSAGTPEASRHSSASSITSSRIRANRATTHWLSFDLLPLVGAIPMTERVVKDRNRITSAGVTAGIDMA